MSDVFDSLPDHFLVLKRLLLDICQIDQDVSYDTQLIGGHLPISSLQIITYISAIEREFSLSFDAEDMDVTNFQTIAAISKMINGK